MSEVERLSNIIYEDLTTRVDYGRITLFRIGNDLYLLRLTTVPTNDPSCVHYEWMTLTDKFIEGSQKHVEWKNTFDRLSVEERGSGVTNESENATVITVGPLAISWSRGSKDSGWLYLSEARCWGANVLMKFEVYGEQLDNLSELTQLNPKHWKPIRITR